LREALTILQQLTFHGIRVIFISQGIDTHDEQAEVLFEFHGIVDSLDVREMAKKIRRGLQGQLGRGFATGGVTYGYRTVPIPDPDRHDAPLGFRVEIDPTESLWVRKVFEWYAEGMVMPTIIAKLREAGAPAPRGGGSRGDWRFGAVRRLLRNPRYLGRLIWGRTRTDRRPGTGKKVQRHLRAREMVADRPNGIDEE
jgi:site-specific DNA recombinase